MNALTPIQHNLLHLLRAAGWTLVLAGMVVVPATLLGAILAALRLYAHWSICAAIDVYLFLMRGLPLLVLLTFVYYLLPLTGFDMPPIWDVTVVLALYYAPFMSEVFRAGIAALPRAQWDAARSLGMPRIMMLRLVIYPQAARLAGPPYINLCVNLVKATSLASVVGVLELTRASHEVVERTMAPFQILVTAAAIYFAICFGLAQVGNYIERGTVGSH